MSRKLPTPPPYKTPSNDGVRGGKNPPPPTIYERPAAPPSPPPGKK